MGYHSIPIRLINFYDLAMNTQHRFDKTIYLGFLASDFSRFDHQRAPLPGSSWLVLEAIVI